MPALHSKHTDGHSNGGAAPFSIPAYSVAPLREMLAAVKLRCVSASADPLTEMLPCASPRAGSRSLALSASRATAAAKFCGISDFVHPAELAGQRATSSTLCGKSKAEEKK